MKTKDHIIESARLLFNQRGLRNTTLRDIATALGKSYGNVTYHFSNKQDLLEALYQRYLNELEETVAILQKQEGEGLDLLLTAPKYTFELSWRYLFFFVDYVELRRHYPRLGQRVDQEQEQRKSYWLMALKGLQKQGFLRADLGAPELDYLMELSGVVRTFFFQKWVPSEPQEMEQFRRKYVLYVNQLLWPYLSDLGQKRYHALGY